MAPSLLPVVSYGLEIRPGQIVPVATEDFDGPQPTVSLAKCQSVQDTDSQLSNYLLACFQTLGLMLDDLVSLYNGCH
jgi:hypothetical protein